MKSIGTLLKAKQGQLSMARFAHKIGVPMTTYRQWVVQPDILPNYLLLKKICESIGIDENELRDTYETVTKRRQGVN